jgi:hypothetical protein
VCAFVCVCVCVSECVCVCVCVCQEKETGVCAVIRKRTRNEATKKRDKRSKKEGENA